MSKIVLKDYIGWAIAIICALIATGFWQQNNELKGVKNTVNTYIQNIQQNNYYTNLPPDIKNDIDKIAGVTGNTVTFNK